MAEKFIPKTPYLSTDCVIINSAKQILLIKRAIEPCVGSWVLPGGLVEIGETTEQAVVREVKEETGLDIKDPQLLGVYSDPRRDSRWHCVNVTYFSTEFSGELVGNEESSEQKFFDLDDLPEDIGFDHKQIIEDYKKGYSK